MKITLLMAEEKTLRCSTNDNILHITEGVGRWQATNVHPRTRRSYSPVKHKQFRQLRQFTEPQPPTTNNGSWHIHRETGQTKRYSDSGRRNSSSSKAYGRDHCSRHHSRNRIPFTGSLWPGSLHSWPVLVNAVVYYRCQLAGDFLCREIAEITGRPR